MPSRPNYAGDGSRTANWAEYQNYIKPDTGATRYGKTGQDWARGLLGGPVGWYEIASGKGLLGGSDPFAGTTIYNEMTEDVYNSMSPEEWASFAKMSGQEQANFVNSRRRVLQEEGQGEADALAAEKADKAKADAFQTWRMQNIQKLEAFANEMGMSVDELVARGDYGVKAAGTGATNRAGTAAYAAGLGTGGVSNMNTQRAVADAQLKYQMQRQGLGMQARSNLLGQMGALSGESEDLRRYEQGMNLQMQQAQAASRQQQYQQGLASSGNTLGMIGMAAGAYFGGPQGAQAGYQLGSGLGQQQYTQSNPYQPYQYKYPGTKTSTAGLGGSYNPNKYGAQ